MWHLSEMIFECRLQYELTFYPCSMPSIRAKSIWVFTNSRWDYGKRKEKPKKSRTHTNISILLLHVHQKGMKKERKKNYHFRSIFFLLLLCLQFLAKDRNFHLRHPKLSSTARRNQSFQYRRTYLSSAYLNTCNIFFCLIFFNLMCLYTVPNIYTHLINKPEWIFVCRLMNLSRAYIIS